MYEIDVKQPHFLNSKWGCIGIGLNTICSLIRGEIISFERSISVINYLQVEEISAEASLLLAQMSVQPANGSIQPTELWVQPAELPGQRYSIPGRKSYHKPELDCK